MSKPQLLTNNQAAAFLGVSPSTLTTWRCTKRYALPFIKVGGCVRYAESDLIEFIAARRIHGSS